MLLFFLIFSDMVKIHAAVIAILSTLFIATQARNVNTDLYAQDSMDRMVKINSKELSPFSSSCPKNLAHIYIGVLRK